MQRRNPVPANRGYRKKQAAGQSRAVALIAIAAMIALMWFLLDTVISLGVGEQRFYNVYVNGVCLKGYTREQGYRLFSSLEENWAGRNFELAYGDDTWSFSPAMINAELNEEDVLARAWNFGHVGSIFKRKEQVKSLTADPVYLTSAISYDEELMESFLRTVRNTTDIAPTEAQVVLDVSAPRILTESADGSALKMDETLALLNDLMLSGADGERVELPVEVLKPSVNSEDASGSLNMIAEFSTSLKNSRSSRKWNIAKALQYFNAVTLAPGMQMGFNEVVGERSKARGFKKAPEFSEGTTTEDYGGGVCQASTTLYGALLQSGLTIVQRSAHSMTVAYVWPSLDAAVTNTGSKDLVFRNDTESPMYIYTEVTGATATVRIFGSKPAYRYGFEYKVLEDNIVGTSEVVRPDATGEYATYTDEKVLASEAKMGRKSEGWLISYDWETGEEVTRVRISSDYYRPGVTVYYTGTQVRGGATASASPSPW